MVQANSRRGYPARPSWLCVVGFSGPGISSKLQSLLVYVVDELCSTFVMAVKCKRTDLSLSDKIEVVNMLDTTADSSDGVICELFTLTDRIRPFKYTVPICIYAKRSISCV